MRQPDTGTERCLVGQRSNAGEPFSELRIGLDHLELLVDDRGDLDEWTEHLDAHGVVHSGVKFAPASKSAMVTFRDPDNIQLELFWHAPDPIAASGGHVHGASGAASRSATGRPAQPAYSRRPTKEATWATCSRSAGRPHS